MQTEYEFQRLLETYFGIKFYEIGTYLYRQWDKGIVSLVSYCLTPMKRFSLQILRDLQCVLPFFKKITDSAFKQHFSGF